MKKSQEINEKFMHNAWKTEFKIKLCSNISEMNCNLVSKAIQQVGLTDNKSSYGKQHSSWDDSVEAFPKDYFIQYVSILSFWKCSKMKNGIRPFYF